MVSFLKIFRKNIFTQCNLTILERIVHIQSHQKRHDIGTILCPLGCRSFWSCFPNSKDGFWAGMWTVKIRNSKLTDVWKVKTFKDEFLQFHEYWYCPTGKTFPANFNVLLTFLFYSSSLKDKISLARRLNCDWGVLIRRRGQRSSRFENDGKVTSVGESAAVRLRNANEDEQQSTKRSWW